MCCIALVFYLKQRGRERHLHATQLAKNMYIKLLHTKLSASIKIDTNLQCASRRTEVSLV